MATCSFKLYVASLAGHWQCTWSSHNEYARLYASSFPGKLDTGKGEEVNADEIRFLSAESLMIGDSES